MVKLPKVEQMDKLEQLIKLKKIEPESEVNQ
jgi:hypothetical protein